GGPAAGGGGGAAPDHRRGGGAARRQQGLAPPAPGVAVRREALGWRGALLEPPPGRLRRAAERAVIFGCGWVARRRTTPIPRRRTPWPDTDDPPRAAAACFNARVAIPAPLWRRGGLPTTSTGRNAGNRRTRRTSRARNGPPARGSMQSTKAPSSAPSASGSPSTPSLTPCSTSTPCTGIGRWRRRDRR